MKPQAIIVDIDGTIADATHRLHHIKDGKRDWEPFFDAMVDDTFMHDAWAKILKEVSYASEELPRVIFLTARPDSHWDQTVKWITDHVPAGLPAEYELLMRKKGDHRPDIEVKAELYDKLIKQNYNVILAFEDRPAVLRMWLEKGLTAVQMGTGEEF